MHLASSAMKTTLGRFGRLGLWTADHRRAVALAWLTVAVGLGGLAPFAEHALSGAGWVAVGSQSDREAKLVDRHFPGQGSYALFAVVRADAGLRSPAGRETVARVRRVLESPPPCVASFRSRLRLTDGRASSRASRHKPDEDGACGRGPREAACRGGGAGRHRPADRPGGDVGRLQHQQQAGDDALGGPFLAADDGPPRDRVRHARRRRAAASPDDGRPRLRGRRPLPRRPVHGHLDLGDELRDDVRDRARDRLRALRGRPLPRGARRRGRFA